jgi:hypothetical protein
LREAEYRFGEHRRLAVGGRNLTDADPDKSNADIDHFGNLPCDVLSPIGSDGADYHSRVRDTF